jgi:hypothetical protein
MGSVRSSSPGIQWLCRNLLQGLTSRSDPASPPFSSSPLDAKEQRRRPRERTYALAGVAEALLSISSGRWIAQQLLRAIRRRLFEGEGGEVTLALPSHSRFRLGGSQLLQRANLHPSVVLTEYDRVPNPPSRLPPPHLDPRQARLLRLYRAAREVHEVNTAVCVYATFLSRPASGLSAICSHFSSTPLPSPPLIIE